MEYPCICGVPFGLPLGIDGLSQRGFTFGKGICGLGPARLRGLHRLGQLRPFGGDFLGRGSGFGQFLFMGGFARLQFGRALPGGFQPALPCGQFLGYFLYPTHPGLALAAQFIRQRPL